MYLAHQTTFCGLAVAAFAMASPSWAADDPDLGALGLSSAPTDAVRSTRVSSKMFMEASAGNAEQRFADGSYSLRRASFDAYLTGTPMSGWRAVFSDRVDHVKPRPVGGAEVLNSVREAYVSTDLDAGNVSIDIGRINLRYGPGYGYNPTDFFKDGSLRSVTTANPLALRENRLGTAALRVQRTWQAGSASVALSPKLANSPSDEPLSIDFGATNNRARLLLEGSIRFSERLSVQGLLYKEPGAKLQPGASVSALVGDSTVLHGEWAYARRSGAETAPTGVLEDFGHAHKLSTGLTYTTSTKTSITGEIQYNGTALNAAGWQRVSEQNPAALPVYLIDSQRVQESASRLAYLLYLTQRDMAGIRGLDLTGFVRVNANDRSRLVWTEFRYRLESFDLALQWQVHHGRGGSEYGLFPDRRIAQLMVAKYFN